MSPVHFTNEEIARIPSQLHPLMQKYPIAFDNFLENQYLSPLRGQIQSIDLYFDNGLIPALSLFEGKIKANPDTLDPQVLTVFANDQCVYIQINSQVLLNRARGRDFMKNLDLSER
jgi:hypothetical protein